MAAEGFEHCLEIISDAAPNFEEGDDPSRFPILDGSVCHLTGPAHVSGFRQPFGFGFIVHRAAMLAPVRRGKVYTAAIRLYTCWQESSGSLSREADAEFSPPQSRLSGVLRLFEDDQNNGHPQFPPDHGGVASPPHKGG